MICSTRDTVDSVCRSGSVGLCSEVVIKALLVAGSQLSGISESNTCWQNPRSTQPRHSLNQNDFLKAARGEGTGLSMSTLQRLISQVNAEFRQPHLGATHQGFDVREGQHAIHKLRSSRSQFQ